MMTPIDPLAEWLNFYRPFFDEETNLRAFISACEEQLPPETRSKLIMHQTARLATLGDDAVERNAGCDALGVLFLLINAECVAKLAHRFTGEGQSKRFVKRFYSEFSCPADQRLLAAGVRDSGDRELGLEGAVEVLYGIRCDVVHEGAFWDLRLNPGGLPMVHLTGEGVGVAMALSLSDLRAATVRTAISAARRSLDGTLDAGQI